MTDIDTPSPIEVALVATRENWMKRGACRGIDPALFFTTKGQPTNESKACCTACPVKAECLDYALRNGEMFGMWGGTSEKERRRMRREQGITQQRRLDRKAIKSEMVATVANAAKANGEPVAQAVALALGCSDNSAKQMVSVARKAGYDIPYDYRGWVA